MDSKEIRGKFLKFFEKRGHAIIPSASLVPENDPSVLFTTAGMQPLVPYLLGAPHPAGKRLVNAQKCVRTQDIDEVGDNTHDTFFEMLGNWSLGGYFKEDAIKWSYEFLTSKEEGLGLDPNRLYVTVFEGNDDAPRDNESAEIWKKIFEEKGIKGERIYFLPASKNWWSAGDNGPCGPDTEMFYDVTGKIDKGMSKEEYLVADERQDVVEIWNDVFMEYEKKDGKVIGKLKNKNVDTGAGLERLTMVMQETNNVFDTDLFAPLMKQIRSSAGEYDERAARIIADHIRTAVFMIADGVVPSNTDQGYILRRLLRRAVRYADVLGISHNMLSQFVPTVAQKYKGVYNNITQKAEHIATEIRAEEDKFRKTLGLGLIRFEKVRNLGDGEVISSNQLSAKKAFDLFQTYGFPVEMTKEIVQEKKMSLEDRFEEKYAEILIKHQDLSRAGAEQKFKGGLADTGEKTTMLHTSTHLMLAGLRKYLGNHVHQAGSNITQERTRFDFTHPEKVSPEILKKVEDYVNEAIIKECTVVIEQMPKDEAQKVGVEGSFWEKYPNTVNVYVVKASDGVVYSRELCGGPHVGNTQEIGKFKIIKEEAVAAGVRRIKAVVE
ncbi:MAG: alanine--tRNA ligase [bacterium]|nr:alanine--tRNA ligase [bacterium]